MSRSPLVRGGVRNRMPAPVERGRTRTRHGASRVSGGRRVFAMFGRIARLGAVGLVGAVVVSAGWFAAPQVRGWIDEPVRGVEIPVAMRHQDVDEVRAVIASFDLGSFFALDLEGLRAELEDLVWVQAANVRRVWPDRLQVTIREQTPIAIWREDALLNEMGELFAPGNVTEFTGLPVLDGPDGTQKKMMQTYDRFSPLLSAAGLRMSRLQLSARGGWEIELDSGVILRLGRAETLERLRRFTVLHDRFLSSRLATVGVVDARYSNGIAVTWKEGIEEALEDKG